MLGNLVESAVRCSESDCNFPAKIEFNSRNACLTHFCANCYQKLDEIGRDTRNWRHGGPQWETARRITRECAEKAAELSQLETELSNLERARLLDIKLWAAELGRQLRRGRRSETHIAIRLVSEIPRRSWSEETRTINVSIHGSQILCRNDVKVGDMLKVFRLDKGINAEVRVVWLGQAGAEGTEIGVEIVGDYRFWVP